MCDVDVYPGDETRVVCIWDANKIAIVNMIEKTIRSEVAFEMSNQNSHL